MHASVLAVLFIAIACAYMAREIALGRGRWAPGWMLAAALLGPLAVLILWLSPPKRSRRAAERGATPSE